MNHLKEPTLIFIEFSTLSAAEKGRAPIRLKAPQHRTQIKPFRSEEELTEEHDTLIKMNTMIREKLQEQLQKYILQSLKYTETVKKFCDGGSKWILQRETELEMLGDIKDRADQITLKFDHVRKSEHKAKALGEYMLSSMTKFTADSKRQELEKELGKVLKNTLEGLEKLHLFLDAVEKLAVTSLFVFMGESIMPNGVRAEDMCSVISTARIVSPLLVHFKRDAGDFFLPILSNVDVLVFQLDKYIRITQQICEKMCFSRHKEEKLQEQLREYILQSVKYTKTLKEFCNGESKWTLQRETELKMMRDIRDQADQITLKFDHVQKSEHKAKAFGEYMLSRLTANIRRQELEKELEKVLKNTLKGLEKFHTFLDAVEKLAVTSLFVFMGESIMPNGVRAEDMCSVISTARIVSPLLVHFKRDAGDFFLPILSNVDILVFQLDKYICITQQICEMLCFSHHKEWKNMTLTLGIGWKNDESVQKLYSLVTQLIQIRKDESFRINFLFSENAQDFISLFTDCGPRMLDFLSKLEEAAVQLDRMKKGSHISTVAGSSVGIAGGVLSIVGLALAPVTAGVSLALTLTGVGLGVTSGVNGIVTGITEMAVNKHHGQNANNIFIRFMEDVQKILDCIEVTANTERPIDVPDGFSSAFTFGKIATRLGTVGKGIDAIVDAASAVKALSSEEVIAKAVAVGLQEANAGRSIPKLAADLPDVGQLAKGTPLALSNSARAGFVAVNALFIGLDLIFIVNSSMSLAKGSKNEVAQIIRERSVLWCSEVKAWQKIHDQLCKGTSGFQKNLEILNQPFNI
ncbi:apolipoprotein L4 [Silurus meridionalis]|nr:apolipoprotein L4 [Silurus meridionalis]